MAFNHGLTILQTVKNDEISRVFKCGTQGGMRRSLKTNTLVIISDHTKMYEDRWVNDVLHYTGMGMRGDQSLSKAQNKTLAKSQSNGVEVYLFEAYEPSKYIFMGQVELAAQPYQDDQEDADDKMRKVWIFPVRIIGQTNPPKIPAELLAKKQAIKDKQARKLSDNDLKNKAEIASRRGTKTTTRSTTTTTIDRDPYVTEYAKRRAKGKCQLCDQPAPFKDKKGNAYLETHHVVWLSRGGADSIENTVALCPNCHRKMHSLELKTDVDKLLRVAQKK